ncbi:DUF4179 domain-containing protein [Bacillus sp. FJAT-27445]|uniref:DUF4179 domain-containing protein n=1 Tax=Bacillus sp. FJAT-27445 TaxID=1679166 RepID=UPI000AE01D94|nr:DUF4179 domain-containing protein [Bacillus sp. FJAT-27445]
MIPAKIEPISNTPIREKSVESIFDWFDHHKQSFYILGSSYLGDQQQMEELFYRTILKVHKELPRFKKETSFETRVTSIFIQTYRELSIDGSPQVSEESEQAQDVFKSLDQLKKDEREALVLTYIKGFSREDAALLLNVSEEKLKEQLFTGIQTLKKGLGFGLSVNGCKEYHKNYIDYLERIMDRPEKVDFEIHIYHCENCQEDLAAFQDVMLTIRDLTKRVGDFHVPSNFMENVKARLTEREKHRKLKNKKLKRIGIVFASIFAFLIAIQVFTGTFSNLYYAYTEEDEQLRPFLQQGLGEMLNLEAENKGVKIRIKSAIADDVQTLIFYEVEDTAKDHQYAIDNFGGVLVKNEREIMNHATQPRFYPPDLKSDFNAKEKNVYQGKMSLLPIKTDKAIMKLRITKLQKLISDSSSPYGYSFSGNMVFESGEWNFEIPITKQPSVEYALDGETEIEGIPVRFDKLTIAPTMTILQYAINQEQRDKRIEFLNFDNLEVNNKKVNAEMYGSTFLNSDMNWTAYQMHFDPLFEEKPKEVNVQFKSVYLTIEDLKIIDLDASQDYPQTFEYAGSTISIDKLEVGQSTKFVISDHEIKNRAYESLQLEFIDEVMNGIGSMTESEGVLVDKNGVKYDINTPVVYEEIEQPRYFVKVQTIVVDNLNSTENRIPKSLRIHMYNTTKYLDDVVKISVQ